MASDMFSFATIPYTLCHIIIGYVKIHCVNPLDSLNIIIYSSFVTCEYHKKILFMLRGRVQVMTHIATTTTTFSLISGHFP